MKAALFCLPLLHLVHSIDAEALVDPGRHLVQLSLLKLCCVPASHAEHVGKGAQL